MSTVVLESSARQAASFDAVRRRVFLEMHTRTRRWLVLFIMPTYLTFALVLALSGSKTRALIAVGALVVCFGAAFSSRPSLNVTPFAFALLHSTIVTAVSGGICSPLLPFILPMVGSAAIIVPEKRQKVLLLGAFAASFVALGFVSAQPWGALPAPFIVDGSLTTAYFMTTAYREELCDAGSNHSRVLEGVAARLAHEMNNPLASIKALSAHVARSCTDEKTAERVAFVAVEAERLRTIVDGFISFSRSLEDLRPSMLRPHEVARELATILESRLADRGQVIEVIGDEKLELEADPRKLRQALHNLVQNAMEASARNAVVTVAVVLTKDTRVRIRVIDHGEGMTPEVLERIQRPHFSTRQGQSGLGIALARAIIAQHGGELRFESEPERGTTATIELPYCALVTPEGLPRPEVDVSTCGRKKQKPPAW